MSKIRDVVYADVPVKRIKPTSAGGTSPCGEHGWLSVTQFAKEHDGIPACGELD